MTTRLSSFHQGNVTLDVDAVGTRTARVDADACDGLGMVDVRVRAEGFGNGDPRDEHIETIDRGIAALLALRSYLAPSAGVDVETMVAIGNQNVTRRIQGPQ